MKCHTHYMSKNNLIVCKSQIFTNLTLKLLNATICVYFCQEIIHIQGNKCHKTKNILFLLCFLSLFLMSLSYLKDSFFYCLDDLTNLVKNYFFLGSYWHFHLLRHCLFWRLSPCRLHSLQLFFSHCIGFFYTPSTLRIGLAILDLLWFHINFLDYLFWFCEKCHVI